jgi:cytoskeleton protein RodZ
MQETSNQQRSASTKGPGEFLGESRRKLGLEPENVAQILHLSVQQITAIEADDFDALPEPTYVRGYLRSYSQLLNVDPEEVIKAYDKAIGGWKTATYSGLATEKQATSTDSLVRFATMGVIGLVIGLAVVWWLGEDEETVGLAPPPAEVSAFPADPVTAGESVPETRETEDLGAEPEPSAIPAIPASAAPTAGDTAATEVVPKPVKEPVTVVEPAAEPVKPEPEVVEQPKPVIKPAATPPEVNIPAGSRARIILRTTGVSWVDIRDANDNKLLYESVAAGREIAIEGESPIQVFLGNADAVSLEFNDVDYDFSVHKQGKWARFKLGQSKTALEAEEEQ